jgi:hypothetical protein
VQVDCESTYLRSQQKKSIPDIPATCPHVFISPPEETQKTEKRVSTKIEEFKFLN